MMYLENALFFLIVGIFEAYLWHYSIGKISRTTSARLHYPLVAIRAAWFYFLWVQSEHDYGSLIPLFICYPFFHLGAMYQTRHQLNPKIYAYGFFSNASTSSTSLLDRLLPLDAFTRTAMCIVGTLLYLIWNI